MSAHIPPGNAEIWFQMNTGGDPEPMYCSLGINLEPGETINTTRADELINTWFDAVKAGFSSSYTGRPGYVLVGQDGGDLRVDSVLAPAAFTGAATGLPNNTAMLIRKVTAQGGRHGRGRMFHPGVLEGDVGTDGAMPSATVAAHQARFNTLKTNLEALSYVQELVLLHDTAPFTETPITALQVQTKVATQRRRMRR